MLTVEEISKIQAVTRKANKANTSSNLQITQKCKIKEPSTSARETSNSQISRVYLQANYQEDRHLIEIVSLLTVNNAA